MKRIRLLSKTVLLAAMVSTLSQLSQSNARAQGTITFANNTSSALTNCETCQRLPVGTTFSVALYSAPLGAPESALSAVAGPIGITGSPGLFNGGAVPILGLSPGESAQFQVRAWDRRGGAVPTYAAAAADPTVLKGKSSTLTASAGSSLIQAGLKGVTLSSSACIVMDCPTNILRPPGCSSGVTISCPTASNQCTGASIPVVCSPSCGSDFTNGTTTLVTCTATDALGNSKECQFNVSVSTTNYTVAIAPQSQVTTNGGNVTFSSTVVGPAPQFFQWRHNGVILPNATNSFYSVTAAKPADEGTYFVTATSTCGLSQTASATLTVLARPTNGALISANAFWKYRFDGTPPAANWPTLAFNDASWPGGRAELGFGDGDEATIIGAASNRFVTAFFRRRFLPPSDPSATNLVLSLRRDDGAVVYLNGTEVFRSNMPTGTVSNVTLASAFDPSDGSAIEMGTIPSSLLVAGMNILAAEVHQSDPASSDLSFELQLTSIQSSGPISIGRVGTNVVLSWGNPSYRLQVAPALLHPSGATLWATVTNTSPARFGLSNNQRFFRLIAP